MKKMNVTFKGFLGIAVIFALALFMSADASAQHFTSNPNVPDFMAATAGKDMSAMASYDLTGTNFLTKSDAAAKLLEEYNDLAPVVIDPTTGAPIPGSLEYVKAVYYRWTMNNINEQGMSVKDALIEAFPQMAAAAEDVPSANIPDIFNQTVNMVSY